MVDLIPKERELAIIDLLEHNTSHSKIMLRFFGVGSTIITCLHKKISNSRIGHPGGRQQNVSEQTQHYIVRLLRIGRLEEPGTVQRYLRLTGIKMTVRAIRKMLNKIGFRAKRKIRTSFEAIPTGLFV
jgi:transposase